MIQAKDRHRGIGVYAVWNSCEAQATAPILFVEPYTGVLRAIS